MHHRYMLTLLMCVSLIFMPGCWDQNLLKDISLVLTSAVDQGEDDNARYSITYRKVQQSQSMQQGNSGSYLTTVLTTDAPTLRKARSNFSRSVDQRIDMSKMRVLLIGDEFAQNRLLPYLDMFYRDPKSPLLANLAVVQGGSCVDLINSLLKEKLIVSDYLNNLITSASRSSQVAPKNIQNIRSKMLQTGEDFTLPLLYYDKSKKLTSVRGVALFDNEKKKGELYAQDAILLTIMDGKMGSYANFTKKVRSDMKSKENNYITIQVTDSKRDIKIVNPDHRNVTFSLDYEFTTSVVEYPKDNLDTDKKIEMLNKRLSAIFTKDAEKVIAALQEANSDVLSLGRKYRVRHYDEYMKMNWVTDYPKVKIIPKVKVNITQTGIIS
ncbi:MULTISPECIES: Ger(x)C family spore germination protein [Bacillus]|uniref:Ger(x)C family spore germination protein n=1 Tax=Bacillus TaxID=1386 RepID=UPI000771A5A0|nr:Ger(x)C family spore germination protein [Bacillus safensis]MCY1095117.1 Ger(x)C family spore germination protein [Bacillus safensis]MCY7479243.1 Ger(x)C family spore germination protein [Bacillus safensis]MCY7512536.1 Ger(x)C family spore germination protein [Bacillus safensis]MCY7543779.1 Ger(x)C family spore germination protein [Bacillus safensis]MCY7551021.1 Ger(x)C family spore germination protein [Bacillus safensis]